jgi:(E)-4-hydroxy-3-methylbut-2-enyl-diphosphate synthase
MGCIVNGPGEMADADYGYVGVGKGKSLSTAAGSHQKAVPEERAVDELIELMRGTQVDREGSGGRAVGFLVSTCK